MKAKESGRLARSVRASRPTATVSKQFGCVRKLCLSLPETYEKLSHGEPTFFAGKRVFVMFSTNHHHDCEWSIMCNAPEGAQEILMKSDPDNFYVPPYVGGAGWVGVRLDRGIAFATISSIVKDAHRVTLQKQKRK